MLGYSMVRLVELGRIIWLICDRSGHIFGQQNSSELVIHIPHFYYYYIMNPASLTTATIKVHDHNPPPCSHVV